MLSKETLAFGEKLAALTLGIDHLYRREAGIQGNLDGLVVINMGQKEVREVENYGEAHALLAELAREAFSLPEEDRRLYYTQACISLDSFCSFREGKLPALGSQIGMFLHVDPASVNQQQLDGYFSQLRTMLTELGYTGDLKEQCAKWEEKNRVPADEVEGTMNQLMEVARQRTGEILELPENDFYHCVTERGSAYNARSDYDHRRVVVNVDPVLTMPALKHLVCHECYPGHFMQFTHRRVRYERGEAAADGLLSVVNHSSSSTFEGIADAGLEFIDWMETPDDKVNAVIGQLRSALGTASSYQMHTLKKSDKEVEDWLRAHTLVGGEGWIQGRMRFIRDTSRAALIWSYWRGDQGVFDVWHRVAPEDRPRFFDYIYGRLHTVQSMQLFR